MEIADFSHYRCDEDSVQEKRKRPREKKHADKFSMLYMFPSTLLNEKGSGTKRKGFMTFDALVCKKCDPARFFHSRSAFKLHVAEDHQSERRFTKQLLPTVSRNTRKVRNIECIDLSDSEEEIQIDLSDSEEEEIQIVKDKEINDEPVNILIMEGLSIANTEYSEKSPVSESGYGSDIECVELNDNSVTFPNKELQIVLKDISEKIEIMNAHSEPVEVTVEEEDPTMEEVEVVLDDEVNAENGHIRNLMKDFQSPTRKRKEKFEESITKKIRFHDDEMLLTEDTEATQGKEDDDSGVQKIVIEDSFSLQDSPDKIIHMGDDDTDEIVVA